MKSSKAAGRYLFAKIYTFSGFILFVPSCLVLLSGDPCGFCDGVTNVCVNICGSGDGNDDGTSCLGCGGIGGGDGGGCADGGVGFGSSASGCVKFSSVGGDVFVFGCCGGDGFGDGVYDSLSFNGFLSNKKSVLIPFPSRPISVAKVVNVDCLKISLCGCLFPEGAKKSFDLATFSSTRRGLKKELSSCIFAMKLDVELDEFDATSLSLPGVDDPESLCLLRTRDESVKPLE